MQRLYLKLLVDYAETRDVVTHADWREIVDGLSESDTRENLPMLSRRPDYDHC
jgi:hypothetical protein